MITPLLVTKFHPPILRKDIIWRRELLERLSTGLWQDNGFVRKLTLVSAPAGFGKTTLVAAWVDDLAASHLSISSLQTKISSAWLSLDESDNDPVRFLAYIIAAVRQIWPEFGHQTESILRLPQPPPSTIILTSLVNELSARSSPFILTIDDYHVIHTTAIHQQLAFLLDHLPANMHLVILTREDPLLPVVRLRARGQLYELRQGDLRFMGEDAAEFLRRGSGITLPAADIILLEQHTEGWAAGLQLAALSLRGCEDCSAFIREFTSSDRFVLDYLVEEVFERQSAEVQNFLLQTSVLTRLNGALCDAVMGRNDSAVMLRSIEQANLFIVPLDSAHHWYRYHHLFADLLKQRLRLSEISEGALHRRAGEWFFAQGFTSEAIEHALLAQDWGSAARWIGAASEGLLKRGESVTLFTWCGSLPPPVIQSSLELCLTHAWAALMTGQFEIAEPLLDKAEQNSPPNSAQLGLAAAAQAFLARSRRETARAIIKSEQALLLLPESNLDMRGTIAMNLGLAYWHEGQLAEAEAILGQACELCSKSGNRFALLTAQIFQARIPAAQGKLYQAAAICEKLIQAAGSVPIVCLAHYDLATIHLEWNDLSKAQAHFEKGFSLAQRSGNGEFIQAGHLLRAILAHAQGDEAAAIDALAEADSLARDFPAIIRSRTAAFGVQLALARRSEQMLAIWSGQVNAEVDAHSFYRFVGLTTARLKLSEGKKDEAARILAKIYETTIKNDWGYGMLVVRIMQSLAAQTRDEAIRFIAEALRQGQSESFIRSFLDAGSGIIPILLEAARRGTTPDYLDKILAAMGVERRLEDLPQAIVIEPLSEREIEVLRLVMMGLSNREIASKLIISPGTAKTHIHNLCGKLGVRNRTEAAMKAKELKLA